MEYYEKIARHYEECYRIHGDTCQGVDWPNPRDAEIRYHVMLNIVDWYEIKYGKINRYEILDLGCGLGHLYEYIRKQRWNINYAGIDISKDFVNECRRKFPEIDFMHTDILKEDIPRQYDFIIANGVFTEKLNLEELQMWNFFTKMLKKLFSSCQKGLAFNVMSKDVDWEREDLFHVSLSKLSAWLTSNLTRNFIIRNDYGLYEYTVYVMKN